MASLNPILAHELRTRFRGRWMLIGLTGWLIVVIGLGYLAYLLGIFQAGQFGDVGNRAVAGRVVFEWMSFILLTALLAIVPAIAALTIAAEKDRATFQLLQVTQLGRWGIVWGKLWSSLAFIGLLLVAATPVMAIPLIIGGVDLGDLVLALGFIGLTIVTVGAISLWSSARAKTLRGAIFSSYLWVFVLVIVTLLLFAGEMFLLPHSRFDAVGPAGREMVTMWVNPYVGLASSMMEPLETWAGQANPWVSGPSSLFWELFLRRQPDSFRVAIGSGIGFEDVAFGAVDVGFGGLAQVPDVNVSSTRSPLWFRSAVLYLGVIVVTLSAAARAVAAPAGSIRRFRRRSNGSDE